MCSEKSNNNNEKENKEQELDFLFQIQSVYGEDRINNNITGRVWLKVETGEIERYKKRRKKNKKEGGEG